MRKIGEPGREQVRRESIPRRDSPEFRPDALDPTSAYLLHLQRAVGNRAAVGLVCCARTSRPVQRMQEDAIPSTLPASAQVIAGKGIVVVKGERVDGEITEVLVRKQVDLFPQATSTPHNKHWWFFFKVTTGGKSIWMQVDLTPGAGYRIIWNADKTEAEDKPYEVKKVPSGLTSAMVERVATQIAAERRIYYNPSPPLTGTFPRYSCQDFVQLMAERLGIPL